MPLTESEHVAREETIYPVLWRPRLWLGCHPPLLLIVGCLAASTVPIGLISHNLWWIFIGFLTVMLLVIPLRALARFDPDLIPVARRYRTYARHFPAVGSVGSKLPPPRRHQR